MPRALREYFLDPCAPLPDAVSIYYWTYPSRHVVIARAIAKTNIRFSPVIIGDILKFYPLGYWVVWDAPHARALRRHPRHRNGRTRRPGRTPARLATRVEELPIDAAAEVLVFLEPAMATLEQQATLALERAPTGAQ